MPGAANDETRWSHPDEGVFGLSRLFADGGLELAIDRGLEVANVGPEAVGGPPLDELPVGAERRDGCLPSFPGTCVRAPRSPFLKKRLMSTVFDGVEGRFFGAAASAV
jgi:hypothetical protein